MCKKWVKVLETQRVMEEVRNLAEYRCPLSMPLGLCIWEGGSLQFFLSVFQMRFSLFIFPNEVIFEKHPIM